jgi:hypothetical protein
MKSGAVGIERACNDDIQESPVSFRDKNVLLMIATQGGMIKPAGQMETKATRHT